MVEVEVYVRREERRGDKFDETGESAEMMIGLPY